MSELFVTVILTALFYCLLSGILPVVKAALTLISNAVKVVKLVVFDK